MIRFGFGGGCAELEADWNHHVHYCKTLILRLRSNDVTEDVGYFRMASRTNFFCASVRFAGGVATALTILFFIAGVIAVIRC